MEAFPLGFTTVVPIHPKLAERISDINTTYHKSSMWFSDDHKYKYWKEIDGRLWVRKFDLKGFDHGEWERVNQPCRFTETGYLVQG